MTGVKRKTPYGLDDVIKFGYYRDRLIREVVRTDWKIIDWLWAVHECEFKPEVYAEIEKQKQQESDI